MRNMVSWCRGMLVSMSVAVLGAPGCANEHSPVEDVDDGLCVGAPSASQVLGEVSTLDVDVLLVIDDSGSMVEEQATLAANYASFINVLDRPEVAGSYRIAVTTTSQSNPWCNSTTLGAGTLQLRSCRSRPEAFISNGSEAPVADVLDEACHAICPEEWASIETLPTTTQYDDVPRSRNWIESVAGRTNLPEGLSPAQAMQCIGPQGVSGCQFESPLEAMRSAVLRSYDEGDPNFGFIREHAMLLVVFVTDEVDCSGDPAWMSIFSPEGDRVFWSDPDAPAPTSAVCWNAGVACDDADPRSCHAVDLDVGGNPVAPEDADGLAVLRPVPRYIELLEQIEHGKQAIVPDREVLVTLIGGAGSDGTVTYADADDPAFGDEFGIGPACESPWGRATPQVRMHELLEAMRIGDSRTTFSICDADYSAALGPIAESLAGGYRPACMPGCVADTDPSTPDVLDASCELVQDVPDELDAFADYEDQSIVRCEDDRTLPDGHDVCYVTVTGVEREEYCIEGGSNLQFQLVRREGVYVPNGTEIRASCVMSECTATECPDLG